MFTFTFPIFTGKDMDCITRKRIFFFLEPNGFVRRHRSTFLGGRFSFKFSLPSGCSLLLFESEFLIIGLIPSAAFHEPLVGPEARVARCYQLFGFVELARQFGKVVVAFSFRPVNGSTFVMN